MPALFSRHGLTTTNTTAKNARFLCRWLGVDTIGIVENDFTVSEQLQTALDPYIKTGFVHLEAWGSDEPKQNGAFARCFRRMRPKHDWVAFFDADEFLTVLEEYASPFSI